VTSELRIVDRFGTPVSAVLKVLVAAWFECVEPSLPKVWYEPLIRLIPCPSSVGAVLN
jgi:hypothetical protein